MPSSVDRAGVRLVDAGHDLDQRRFAGAVLAEQRMHLAGPHVEADVGERAHARERTSRFPSSCEDRGSLMPIPRTGSGLAARPPASATTSLTPACFEHRGDAVVDAVVGDDRVDRGRAPQRIRLERCANFEESTSTTSSSAWSISFCSPCTISGSRSMTPSRPTPCAPMNMRWAKKFLRHVVLERAEDDAPARDRSTPPGTITVLRECLSRCSAIGKELVSTCSRRSRQEMHHLERRGAGIHDDGLAVGAERHGGPGDGALLLDVDRLADLEGAAGDADELRRMQRLGAAAHAPEPPLRRAARRCRAGSSPRRCRSSRRARRWWRPAAPDGIQDELVALALVHRPPLDVLCSCCLHHSRTRARLSISFRQNLSCCAAA